MEANKKIKHRSLKELNYSSDMWTRRLKGDGQKLCFAAAFALKDLSDLTKLAKAMPEGIVICDSSMIAGIEHLEQVLIQANELWLRSGEIARKKSIDLLMRITCQRQISEAIAFSKIEHTDSFAIFGIVDSEDLIEESLGLIKSKFPAARRNDALLDFSTKKESLLRKFHNLPRALSRPQIVVALKEKSALLVFSN